MKKELSLAQLEQYLNTLFNTTAFDEKAYNGVQIGIKIPIEKIATAVSVSERGGSKRPLICALRH